MKKAVVMDSLFCIYTQGYLLVIIKPVIVHRMNICR